MFNKKAPRNDDDNGEEDCCWICLDNKLDDDVNPLYSPCQCPRLAHMFCIAKWQLTSKITHCAFCKHQYHHWRQLTTPYVLQSYYDVPLSIQFAFQIKNNKYIIPIQTYPCINVQVVLDTFNMLTGTHYNNVKILSCKVRDPFTNDIITVMGKEGIESTVHFVLIGKAYKRYLLHKRKPLQNISLVSVRNLINLIHSKVNRFISGSTRKNES